jgi:hypothetical protein
MYRAIELVDCGDYRFRGLSCRHSAGSIGHVRQKVHASIMQCQHSTDMNRHADKHTDTDTDTDTDMDMDMTNGSKVRLD